MTRRVLRWLLYPVAWVLWNWPQCPAEVLIAEWGSGSMRKWSHCLRPRWHLGLHEDIDERQWEGARR